MENQVYVSCHAPSLSLLLFETVRSVHDQKGLLIGEVCKEVISEKTDDNEMNREHRTTIYLEHCIPILDNDFFGSVGNVNKQKLQKYEDQYSKKVVGWYSFRRNTKVSSRTLREIVTHKSLIQSLQYVKPEYFIAAFMSASVGANSSTHTYNHIFMRFHPVRAVFEPLKFKIYTMSDKILSANGYSVRNSFPTSSNFEKIISSSQENACPVLSIVAINKVIGECLKVINRELQEAEKDRYELEQQIKNLRKRLSLDNLEDVKVGELEREPELIGFQFTRYNSDVNYNPGRKENPIKVVQPPPPPRVPEDLDLVQIRNNRHDVNNSSSEMQCCKNSSSRRNVSPECRENNESIPKQYSQFSTMVGCADLERAMMGCIEEARVNQSIPESDEDEVPVKDLEEHKIASGSAQPFS